MESRVKHGAFLHKRGYNCSQAVICNYADLLNIDIKDAFKMSEGFGAGIAGSFNMCGAINGAIMVAGLILSDGNLESPRSKAITYNMGKKIMEWFKNKNGAILCHDIKGLDGGTIKRSCRGCVMDACMALEELVFTGQFEKYDGPDEIL